MAKETANGAASGAATGAAAGVVFGPWGIVIGAVIGGVVGAISGDSQRKANRYKKKAAEVKRRQQQMAMAVQRRDLVRSIRVTRAQAVAAGTSESGVDSSAVQGAVGSIGSQGRSSINYFDTQVGLDNEYQTYLQKAGKAQGDAYDWNAALQSGASLVRTIGDAYGGAETPPTTNPLTEPLPSSSSPSTSSSPYPSFGGSTILSPYSSPGWTE